MIDLHIGRQTYDFDCGAKALQTVMAYYGVDVREDELMETLGTGTQGTETRVPGQGVWRVDSAGSETNGRVWTPRDCPCTSLGGPLHDT